MHLLAYRDVLPPAQQDSFYRIASQVAAGRQENEIICAIGSSASALVLAANIISHLKTGPISGQSDHYKFIPFSGKALGFKQDQKETATRIFSPRQTTDSGDKETNFSELVKYQTYLKETTINPAHLYQTGQTITVLDRAETGAGLLSFYSAFMGLGLEQGLSPQKLQQLIRLQDIGKTQAFEHFIIETRTPDTALKQFIQHAREIFSFKKKPPAHYSGQITDMSFLMPEDHKALVNIQNFTDNMHGRLTPGYEAEMWHKLPQWDGYRHDSYVDNIQEMIQDFSQRQNGGEPVIHDKPEAIIFQLLQGMRPEK